MKTTFLEYYKQILEKVSFDPQLMRKEYHKARMTLSAHDLLQLDAWLRGKGMLPHRSKFQSPSLDPDVQRWRVGKAQNAS